MTVNGKSFTENETACKKEIGFVMGEFDCYKKSSLRRITEVTKRFYEDWDEEAYRIYVDGILICYTDYAYGTSHVEEEVRLSLCVRPGVDETVKNDPREMIIDYLRIWQKPAEE